MAEENHSNDRVGFEELLVSNTVQLDAITHLLIQKGIFTQEEFFNMLQNVQMEYKRKDNA